MLASLLLSYALWATQQAQAESRRRIDPRAADRHRLTPRPHRGPDRQTHRKGQPMKIKITKLDGTVIEAEGRRKVPRSCRGSRRQARERAVRSVLRADGAADLPVGRHAVVAVDGRHHRFQEPSLTILPPAACGSPEARRDRAESPTPPPTGPPRLWRAAALRPSSPSTDCPRPSSVTSCSLASRCSGASSAFLPAIRKWAGVSTVLVLVLAGAR